MRYLLDGAAHGHDLDVWFVLDIDVDTPALLDTPVDDLAGETALVQQRCFVHRQDRRVVVRAVVRQVSVPDFSVDFFGDKSKELQLINLSASSVCIFEIIRVSFGIWLLCQCRTKYNMFDDKSR